MINFKLILDSILSPKLVFQKVLNYEIKPSILIEAVLFISIINALFTYTSNYLIYSNFITYYKNENKVITIKLKEYNPVKFKIWRISLLHEAL